jgi:cell division protein FtsW (lipid II flippase)
LAAYRYIWVLGSVVLFLTLMLFGTEVNGARLWIRLTPFVQIEPIEIIKLFIVLFMAAYLAETADVIAAAKWWSVRANLRHLGPLILGWGASMSILVLQRDLGMAVLLLAIFAVMLYVATRRIDLIIGATVIFSVAALLAAAHYPYVADRIASWLHPYRDPLGTGYQALQARYAIAAGGLSGTGYHLGVPSYIPEAATDYVWAVWSEEFGLIGAVALLGIYAAIVLRTLDAARRAPDLYAKLLATGLATTLGVQVIIIVAGVTGLMPLTGITLPLISYGGSSLFANVLLLSLVTSISNDRRPREPQAQ